MYVQLSNLQYRAEVMTSAESASTSCGCSAVRQTIQQFYERRDYPTLRNLLQALREKGVFRGGRSTLSLLLKNMGFKY